MSTPPDIETMQRRLLALAGEVASLRERVEKQETAAAPDAATVVDAEEFAELRENLDELSGIVATHLTAQADKGDGKGKKKPAAEVVVWADMRDADAATTHLTGLAGWVNTTLAKDVSGVKLTPCWPRHPVLVQFLSDLWLAWRSIYRAEADKPLRGTEPLEWHTRHLPALSAAVTTELGTCTAEHRDPYKTTTAGDILGDDELGKIARRWAGNRVTS